MVWQPKKYIGFGGIGYEGPLSRFEVLSATSFCSVHPLISSATQMWDSDIQPVLVQLDQAQNLET